MSQGREDDFAAFYHSELEPELSSLVAGVRRARSRALLLSAVLLTVFVMGLPIIRRMEAGPVGGLMLFLLPAAAIVIPWLIYRSQRGRLNQTYKSHIVPKVLAFIAPGMHYYPGGGITAGEFIACKLYGHFDRSHGEDLFEGEYNGVAVRFSEFKAEEKHQTATKNGTRTTWVTIFEGTVFVGDFKKDFRTRTYVLPDRAESLLGQTVGGFFQKIGNFGAGRGSMVRLEDPEFEKRFVVFAEDQVEARYILAPNLMNSMSAMSDRYGGKIGFAFLDSKVYITLPSDRNRFELRDEASLAAVEELAADIHMFLAIVDILQLNVRIWTKE